MKVVLGQGILSWDPEERRSDRYGTVTLFDEQGKPIPLKKIRSGRKGRLIATVVVPRPSGHIGDFFRNIRQDHMPQRGDEAVFGAGRIFYEEGEKVGLEPVVKKEKDWLDPHQLFKVHDSVVILSFDDAVE